MQLQPGDDDMPGLAPFVDEQPAPAPQQVGLDSTLPRHSCCLRCQHRCMPPSPSR